MASARAMIERRRASRVAASIPVKVLFSGSEAHVSSDAAEAIGISRCGALLRTTFSPVLGSRIHLQNGVSQATREFRVVRVSSRRADGLFDLGLEILNPSRNFWGLEFPDEHSWVDAPPAS
jgi:hypothetical protein